MHTRQNWWEWPLWFRMPLSKLVKFSFQTMKSMGVKKLNLIKLAQKNYASGVGVTCMYANFGERGLFGFGDKTSFLIWSKFPCGPWTSPKSRSTLASPLSEKN